MKSLKKKYISLRRLILAVTKKEQMKRRIDSLITKNKIKSYDEYIEAIKSDKKMLRMILLPILR